MPPPKVKPDGNDGLMLMIGQLLEATQAAADGLKTIGAECRANAQVIVTAVKAVEQIEKRLAELEAVINDGSDSLVIRTHDNSHQIENLERGIGEMKLSLTAMKTALETLGSAHTSRQKHWSFAQKAAIGVIGFAGFVIAQVIAIIAAKIQAGTW